MNKSSIEKAVARAIFHGSEFGKYNNTVTLERVLRCVMIILLVIMLVVTW